MRISFDGKHVPFAAGQTVGAALTTAGIRTLRTTRVHGRPRGIFCGIGVCFDCLVTIDGVPGRRACIEPARDGMLVESQRGAAHDDLAV